MARTFPSRARSPRPPRPPRPPRSSPFARRAWAVRLALAWLALLGAAHAAPPPAAGDDGDGDGQEPTEPAKPPPQRARVRVPERDGMLLIPGGRFPMGTNNPKTPNERPQRVVTVGAFWLDRTEVTVGAYRACVDAKRCERPQRRSATCTYDLGDPELPVSCVRWSDADTYCKSVNKRLPAEAEWEFAARGPEGWGYPWGTRYPDCKLANTLLRENSGRTCHTRPWPVGSAPANASKYGVLDLSGNVQEWTADWYTERLGSLAPLSGASHTLRGGGWLSTPNQSRAAARDWASALEAGPNVGFRCARDAQRPAPPARPGSAGKPPASRKEH